MGKFRKKPVVIEAVQYTEYGKRVNGMCNSVSCYQSGNKEPHVHTIHDNQIVVLEVGDWIIPEPNGINYYPCKPDIFEKSYEMVDSEMAEKNSSAERSGKKELFQILGEMVAADTADGVNSSSKVWRVSRSNDMVSANLRKKGVEITMGIAGGADLIFGLESGKKIPVLFLVDMDEYKKFDK